MKERRRLYLCFIFFLCIDLYLLGDDASISKGSFIRIKHIFVLIHTRIRVRLYHKTSLSPPVKIFLLAILRWCFFCGSFLLFMFRVCHAFLSVHCSLMITCWGRANFLVLLYVMFSCVFVTMQCPGSGVVLDCTNS